jgi:hypothetical protein
MCARFLMHGVQYPLAGSRDSARTAREFRTHRLASDFLSGVTIASRCTTGTSSFL